MCRHRLQLSLLLALAATLALITDAVAHEGEHEGGEVMVISSVVPGSAAETAGLVAGDRILTWDGQEITTQRELNAFLDSHQPGDEIPLTLSRDDRTLELPLTFGQRPDGGVSIGVSLGVVGRSASEDGTEGLSAAECLDWVDENGVLSLAEATPEALVVKAQAKLLDRYAWSVPTLVGQTLYVRDEGQIMAVDLG